MMDVVFDNMVTDMRMRRKIEEDMMQCQWLAEQVRAFVCTRARACVCVCVYVRARARPQCAVSTRS